MESRPKKAKTSPGPKDKSLEAYRAWILEIAKRLTKDASAFKLSEEEWIASWKEYWKNKLQK